MASLINMLVDWLFAPRKEKPDTSHLVAVPDPCKPKLKNEVFAYVDRCDDLRILGAYYMACKEHNAPDDVRRYIADKLRPMCLEVYPDFGKNVFGLDE